MVADKVTEGEQLTEGMTATLEAGQRRKKQEDAVAPPHARTSPPVLQHVLVLVRLAVNQGRAITTQVVIPLEKSLRAILSEVVEAIPHIENLRAIPSMFVIPRAKSQEASPLKAGAPTTIHPKQGSKRGGAAISGKRVCPSLHL